MASERKLTVVLAGDAKGLTKAVGQAEGATGKFGTKLGGLSTTAKVAFAGAATAAFSFAKGSVTAFVEAEQAQARLDDAFAKFPALAGGNIEALRKLNTELMKKTRFDDDALASGQAIIAQFGLTADQIGSVTPLIADYAAKTGKDIPSASKLIGKALLGNTRALKDIGINYKSTGDKAKDLKNIQALLAQQVGGFAEKEGKTAAGQAEILKNQFGELQETVGAKLVPALTRLATVGLQVVDFISRNSSVIMPLVTVLGTLVATTIAVNKATAAGLAVKTAWLTLTGAQTAATTTATGAQVGLNAALTANPIGLIVVAIAGFVAAVVVAYHKVGWFRNLVDGAFRLIKAVISGVFNWVKNNWPLLLGILTGPIGLAVLAITKNWDKIKAGATAVKDWIVAKFNAVVSFFTGLPGRIGSTATRMWNALKANLGEVIRWVRSKLDSLLGPLDEIAGKVGGVVGKIGGAIGKIPGLATGVTNFRGGLAVVGERGPELLNLPRGSDVIPMRGGNHMRGGYAMQPVPVVIELDGQVLGRAMIRFDADYRSANGRPAFGG